MARRVCYSTNLLKAIDAYDLNKVKEILNSKPDLLNKLKWEIKNARYRKMTPLGMALVANAVAIARYLLQFERNTIRIDVEQIFQPNEPEGKIDISPLRYAIKYAYSEMVEALLQAGARIDKELCTFALELAKNNTIKFNNVADVLLAALKNSNPHDYEQLCSVNLRSVPSTPVVSAPVPQPSNEIAALQQQIAILQQQLADVEAKREQENVSHQLDLNYIHGSYQRLQAAYDQSVRDTNERFTRLYDNHGRISMQIEQAKNENTSFVFNLAYLQLYEFYVQHQHLRNTHQNTPAPLTTPHSPVFARPNPTNPFYPPGPYGHM